MIFNTVKNEDAPLSIKLRWTQLSRLKNNWVVWTTRDVLRVYIHAAVSKFDHYIPHRPWGDYVVSSAPRKWRGDVEINRFFTVYEINEP